MVGAHVDGDGPFGVLAHGDALHAHIGGLFLNAAAVGDDQLGVAHQRQELDVSEGIGEHKPFGQALVEAEGGQVLARARMHGKHQRALLREALQGVHQGLEVFFVIHVAGAVEGGQDIVLGLQPHLPHNGVVFEHLVMRLEAVDHDVAHEVYLVLVHAFVAQVADAAVLAHEEVVRHHVGDDAVDLFGHGVVEAAQAGLHMRYGYAHLGGHQGGGQGGVHIAGHDHQVGLLGQQHLFELQHDAGRLLGMAAPADAQVKVGTRQAQVFKKDLRHAVVEMLPGMAYQVLHLLAVLTEGLVERRNLNEIRPGAYNRKEFFHKGSKLGVRGLEFGV